MNIKQHNILYLNIYCREDKCFLKCGSKLNLKLGKNEWRCNKYSCKTRFTFMKRPIYDIMPYYKLGLV